MKRLVLVLVLLWPVGAVADFAAGTEAYDRGDYATAMREWRPLAEAGDAKAQSNLGFMYDTGKGVPKDDAEAVKWYRLGAGQGDAWGQYNLGAMYAFGYGVSRNDIEAAKWYRLAAEQGYADAQYNLGLMHAYGMGVPQNDVRGYVWFARAAAQGHAAGLEQSNLLRARMTPAQLAETSIAELPEIKPALKSEIGSRATLAPQHSGKASQAETPHDQSHLPPAKRFVVRIGSFRTRSRLDAARAQFLELHHDAIDSNLVSTERVDLGAGRGIWNRLIIGPFPERDSAQTWCQRLRDSVFSPDCFVAVRR